MKKTEKYLENVHRVGRIGSVGAIVFMIGVPYLIAMVYDIWPNLSNVLKVSAGLLALFVPIAISEVISFMPVLGSASYITFITGNVLNLKLPCAINAMQMTETPQGTEEGDVISTLAIAASSIATMLIIALGVILLVPLTPLFKNPSISTATKYMLPALFGGMFVPMLLNNKVGDFEVKGRLLPTIIPIILVIIVNQFIRPISGMEGIAILLVIPIMILIARIMYKKGVIKMTPIEEKSKS